LTSVVAVNRAAFDTRNIFMRALSFTFPDRPSPIRTHCESTLSPHIKTRPCEIAPVLKRETRCGQTFQIVFWLSFDGKPKSGAGGRSPRISGFKHGHLQWMWAGQKAVGSLCKKCRHVPVSPRPFPGRHNLSFSEQPAVTNQCANFTNPRLARKHRETNVAPCAYQQR